MSDQYHVDCRDCEFEETLDDYDDAVDCGLDHNRVTSHLPIVTGGEIDG